MRMSDWSSDVCSSDLIERRHAKCVSSCETTQRDTEAHQEFSGIAWQRIAHRGSRCFTLRLHIGGHIEQFTGIRWWEFCMVNCLDPSIHELGKIGRAHV